jgi:hypothetical protein
MTCYFEYAVQKSVARFWGVGVRGGGGRVKVLGQLAAVKKCYSSQKFRKASYGLGVGIS